MGFKIPVQNSQLQLRKLETCLGWVVLNRIGKRDPGLGKEIQDWGDRPRTGETDPGLGKQIQDWNELQCMLQDFLGVPRPTSLQHEQHLHIPWTLGAVSCHGIPDWLGGKEEEER